MIKVLSHEHSLVSSTHCTRVNTTDIRLSVSPRCPSDAPVKVFDKYWILLFQHVQEMIPLIFPPGFKPLGPQAQLALKDIR